jgi:Rhodopirellula transposase DDE domain
MSLTRWTTKSLSKLVDGLVEKGHTLQKSALAKLLASLGFSLKANKKNIEGVAHLDRDKQFQHINHSAKVFESQGNPIISVDCKKKELIGDFKNNGQEWQATGQNTAVNVYDYLRWGWIKRRSKQTLEAVIPAAMKIRNWRCHGHTSVLPSKTMCLSDLICQSTASMLIC